MPEIDFSKLTRVYSKPINPNTILFMSAKTRNRLCQMPYDRHPKGCVNYRNCAFCPPHIGINKSILQCEFIRLVWIKFDYAPYLKLRRLAAANGDLRRREFWTPNRIKSLIYWQNSVKKILKTHIINEGYSYSTLWGCGSGMMGKPSMEAVGINVFTTLKKNKIAYELKPKNFILLVSILGSDNPLKTKQTGLDGYF